jgi:hypothetical protein
MGALATAEAPVAANGEFGAAPTTAETAVAAAAADGGACAPAPAATATAKPAYAATAARVGTVGERN